MTLLEQLHTVARALGPDELIVLCLVAERLKMGRDRYGDLHIATDPRDFRAEALEEAADGLIYAAVALMRNGR